MGVSRILKCLTKLCTKKEGLPFIFLFVYKTLLGFLLSDYNLFNFIPNFTVLLYSVNACYNDLCMILFLISSFVIFFIIR